MSDHVFQLLREHAIGCVEESEFWPTPEQLREFYKDILFQFSQRGPDGEKPTFERVIRWVFDWMETGAAATTSMGGLDMRYMYSEPSMPRAGMACGFGAYVLRLVLEELRPAGFDPKACTMEMMLWAYDNKDEVLAALRAVDAAGQQGEHTEKGRAR